MRSTIEYLMKMTADELEQKSASNMLTIPLPDWGTDQQPDLVKGVKASQNAIYKAVTKLNALGLINDKVTSYPLKRIFSLTEKGRRVAAITIEWKGIGPT